MLLLILKPQLELHTFYANGSSHVNKKLSCCTELHDTPHYLEKPQNTAQLSPYNS